MATKTAPHAAPHHLMLYDGTCAFCHAAVRFVLARDRRRRFRFAALQSAFAAAALAPFGGRPTDLPTFYVIEDHGGLRPALRGRAAAALVVARELGWPWSVLALFRVLPARWLDPLYDLIARHRHGILGEADSCIVPHPEDRERFLEG